MHVLVVEDDRSLRQALAAALRGREMRVHAVAAGAAALQALSAMRYDVVLLDLGLPDMDGVALLPGIRELHAGPVIVVSARRDQSDKVAALDAGADDYMTKPFGLNELLARIRAQARRAGVEATVLAGPLSIDLARGTVTGPDGIVELTATEWGVLAVLARAGGAPVPADELLEQVWDDDDHVHRNYVRVYINLLRRKLEPDPSEPRLILSQPGRGYRLAVDGQNRAPAAEPRS
jgi:two-component system KDP operon response regulator KdpE